jgi:hypothetical protein
VAAFLRLGDKLFDDNEDHGARGEGQGVGQQGLSKGYGNDACYPRDRLDDGRELPVEEAL